MPISKNQLGIAIKSVCLNQYKNDGSYATKDDKQKDSFRTIEIQQYVKTFLAESISTDEVVIMLNDIEYIEKWPGREYDNPKLQVWIKATFDCKRFVKPANPDHEMFANCN